MKAILTIVMFECIWKTSAISQLFSKVQKVTSKNCIVLFMELYTFLLQNIEWKHSDELQQVMIKKAEKKQKAQELK